MPRLEYWYHASMRCAMCTHNWIAEGPVGPLSVECPKCEWSVLLPEKITADITEVRVDEKTNLTRPA